MERTEIIFLEILRAAIRNRKYHSEHILMESDWKEIFRLSMYHDIVPLIMNSVFENNSLKDYPTLRSLILQKARKLTVLQAQHTADFLMLYEEMHKNGFDPVVLKGIICRNLYETPELRPSIDEDLLIPSDEIRQYHSFLTQNGFSLTEEDIYIEKAYEISYRRKSDHLYLEIHRSMFPVSGSPYSDLNQLFSPFENTVSINIYETDIRTLGYTDHFLYMICHAYKHMLYGGVGIRQICDISLFAERYGQYIDWNRIYSSCCEKNLEIFLQAVMKICVKYIGLDAEVAECGSILQSQNIDEVPLLEDILSGGTYGTADENRAHSATMTLRAVSADHTGNRNDGIRRTLFPSLSDMTHNYPYLKKYTYLLPLAWIQRIVKYLANNKKNDPVKSIQIGNKRIELLKKYKIIK